MEDWKDRLVNEYKELNERENKLWFFVHKNPEFDKLDKAERDLLIWQLTGMTTYIRALEARIEYYKIKIE